MVSCSSSEEQFMASNAWIPILIYLTVSIESGGPVITCLTVSKPNGCPVITCLIVSKQSGCPKIGALGHFKISFKPQPVLQDLPENTVKPPLSGREFMRQQ